MISRVFLVAGLAAALGASVASASIGDDKTETQKDKTNAGQKGSQAGSRGEPSMFTLTLPYAEGGYLGVFLEEVTPERAKDLGLTEERGAVVMKVVQGSPAEKAGLKENDVIVGFNARRVDSVREMHRLLTDTPPGRTVSIEVIRGRNHQTLSAVLTKRTNDWSWRPEIDERIRKSTEEAMKRAEQQLRSSEEALKHQKELGKIPKDFGNYFFVGPGEFGYFTGGRLGVGVESLTDQLAAYFGIKDGKGVLVTQVDENSPAAKAGIKAGDVITAVDNESVGTVDSLIRAVGKKESGQISLRVVRNKSEQTFTVTLEKPQNLLHPMFPRRRAGAMVSVSAREV
jgi:predicted metalloprotease with PDZ domain